ncbi:MAG: AI-2E family transporter [Chloroflexota bacterium]|nr:MAG: AI-2E family transporter [Chloroflexota bacterium]
MRRLVWYTTVILLTLAVLALLWEFRSAAILFFLSLAVAAVFRPGIEYLTARRIPRTLAILIVYLAGMVPLAALVFLASGQFGREFQQATDNFAVSYTSIQETWMEGTPFQQAVAAQLPPLDSLYDAITGDRGTEVISTMLGFASSVGGAIASGVIVLALSIYWSIDRIYFERLWLSLLPAARRTRAREIWREIEVGVGGYIRSELIQSLTAAILLSLIYALFGIKYPILLGLAGALAWLIPWLGAVLAVILPFWVAATSIGLPVAILAAIATLAVLFILEVMVEPRLFNRRRYSSLLIVLMLIALAEAYGLVGLIIAPPLAAAIQILLQNLAPRTPQPVFSGTEIQGLRERLRQAREMAASQETPASPEMVNLVERMDALLEQTESLLGVEEEQETAPGIAA